MGKPFFSIIIVCYNAVNTISQTIHSVLAQSFDNYEIIIKDGGSTDGTLDKVPSDNAIKVISEKDSGIYDAMNQALKYAQGEYIHFLNCGDRYFTLDVLEKVHEHIMGLVPMASASIIYGDYQRKSIDIKQPSKMTEFSLFKSPINHQTMFFYSECFELCGNYNLDYRICADHDFTIRALHNNILFSHISITICDYEGDGVSEKYRKKALKEYKMLIKKNYKVMQRFLFNTLIILSLKPLRERVASDHSPDWLRRTYRNLINMINK